MPREHQGMAASLVMMVVNYSISLGLGFAGTVESRVLANGGTTLEGYRSAWYVAIGLAGMGMAVALAFVAIGQYWRQKDAAAGEEAARSEEEEVDDGVLSIDKTTAARGIGEKEEDIKMEA